MRTEKELWEVVLSRPDLFETGLCLWILIIHIYSFMNDDEYLKLRRSIKSNRTSSETYWIGKSGEIQPRIEWIKKRIETL